MPALNKLRAAIRRQHPTLDVQMYRSPAGYYYFDGADGGWFASLYAYSLNGNDPGDVDLVLHHVQSEVLKAPSR